MTEPKPRTRDELAADLRALGVERGDTLFVHSSFKSLGPLDGGAGAMVAAIEDVIGPDGLLLMPSFNLHKGDRAATWNHATSPATTGWLTEFFRQMPGTVRSDHYSHAVAARGRGAAEIVAGHRRHEGMKSPWDLAPWGASYGEHSPMILAMNVGAMAVGQPRPSKVLMLGVDYHSSTYTHVVEVIDWNRRLATDAKAEYFWLNREKLGAWWDEQGRVRRGRVGLAECRLFGIRDFVETCCEAVVREPWVFYKWYPKPEGV
ncbi:MAG: AAC(3) family N-acetyltransferase [Planctomycetota bacterium]|nr:AAC(3) family N-acetyltransferase [Planctomycetota bacterium]